MYDDNLPRYYYKTYRCVFDNDASCCLFGRRALRGGRSGTTHVETLACSTTMSGWVSLLFNWGVFARDGIIPFMYLRFTHSSFVFTCLLSSIISICRHTHFTDLG
jgi:energy-converting hydrogenase Eha subunit H